MSIKTICHLADIHIRKSPSRHEEYRNVFDKLYKSLREKNPDRIVIVGDLFHDFIDLQPEATILAGSFLKNLAKIAPVRITRGNHDIRKKALKRKDSIEAIIENIDNDDIKYYNETGFFDDENVTWAVWKHGEKNNTPWKKGKKPKDGNVVIDLFHDPINGSQSPTGFEFNSKTYNSINSFKGDYSFFGDIHKLQYFKDKTKAYCGSLIAQNFGEGDYDFHGYLLWDIQNGDVEEIEIKNDHSFVTVAVNAFTDFDDLDIDIEEPTKLLSIRVLWKTRPETQSEENKRKISTHLKERYNPTIITHKNEFIEDDKLEVDNDIDVENIFEQSMQHEIFSDYLEKIGISDDISKEILKLDDQIAEKVEIEELTNIQWNIVKFSGKNFMSYEDIDIDWRDLNGLFQITGFNAVGKTTIMKLITYILYNKTKETEKTMKFGDQRYVNNRNGATYCEGSAVIDVNGQYYGIKRKTTIEKKKDGEIKGAPTVLNYYRLQSPDDEMNDDNSLENLIDDEKNKTQAVIERAIGSYDNFMRVVMTTSDTLNDILSSDKATFIDSILYDSGLDIFDHKLNVFKEYLKELSALPRVSCNIENSEDLIKKTNDEIVLIDEKIKDVESNKMPDVEKRIQKGNEYVENLVKSLNKISDEIYNLDITKTKQRLEKLNSEITSLKEKEERLKTSISSLKSLYDEEKLIELSDKKDNHYKKESEVKLAIKELERKIIDIEHKIAIINGDIKRKKDEGSDLKEKLNDLKNQKNCPTCGQLLDDNHQKHLEETAKKLKSQMFEIADLIKRKSEEIPEHQKEIDSVNSEIEKKKEECDNMSLEMEKILTEIGEITNDKNEVERRKELMVELSNIPLQIENYQLQIENINSKIDLFDQSQKQIEENKKIEDTIEKAKSKLRELNFEKDTLKDDVYSLNTKKGQLNTKIGETKTLIEKFKEQERNDLIHNTYKKCIHRDGIPTQLLKNFAIPKINSELSKLLSNVGFNVWLDDEDLKLKLAYNSRLDAPIDAISASGKERTFASVTLKFALNQINMKSKPTIFLLDEVTGKLVDESVEEFNEIISLIKNRMSKTLIIEHNHFIDPDYYIHVTKDDNDISSLNIE